MDDNVRKNPPALLKFHHVKNSQKTAPGNLGKAIKAGNLIDF